MAKQTEIDNALHVIRNPYGYDDHVVRNAREIVADAYEELVKKYDNLKAEYNDLMNITHG